MGYGCGAVCGVGEASRLTSSFGGEPGRLTGVWPLESGPAIRWQAMHDLTAAFSVAIAEASIYCGYIEYDFFGIRRYTFEHI
jgi:hypothetical protein